MDLNELMSTLMPIAALFMIFITMCVLSLIFIDTLRCHRGGKGSASQRVANTDLG